MARRPEPLFVRAPGAARLLDMRRDEFLDLVAKGALPGPTRFGRWDVEQLVAAMRAPAMRAPEDRLEI